MELQIIIYNSIRLKNITNYINNLQNLNNTVLPPDSRFKKPPSPYKSYQLI